MSNNREMAKISCYLAILALGIPFSNYGSEPHENIYINVDPSTRSEKLEADISGFNTITSSSGILKKEFQESERRMRYLAKSILTSQLEPGKPEYLDRDNQRCITREEILGKRMPYIAKEINRLLQPDNARYFELVSIGDISPVMFSFNEWGSSLKYPKDRIQFWNRVLSLLPETSKDLRREPLRQLVYAHASYGGQLMLSDRQAAKSEINLAESLIKNVVMDSEFPGILENFKRWIERKPEPPAIKSSDLIGEYSGGLFGSSYTLKLREGNKYDFVAHGDVLTLCPVQPKQGEFVIQGRYLILMPGPHILYYYGFEAPEVMVPIIWGTNVFLIGDSGSNDGIMQFCNIANSRSTDSPKSLELSYYHKTKDPMQIDDELKGKPLLPEEWQDCILAEPLNPEVIKVEEKSVLVLNMGHDAGLRVGMLLYLKNPYAEQRGAWKITDVNATEARAVAQGNSPTISVGEKLSTRAPY